MSASEYIIKRKYGNVKEPTKFGRGDDSDSDDEYDTDLADKSPNTRHRMKELKVVEKTEKLNGF